jgi:hypothetical protein
VSSSSNVDKDLDNLGLDIATAFNSTFESVVQIDAFRAYIVDDGKATERPRVLARLIGPNAVGEFHNTVFDEIEDLLDRL